MWLYRVESDMTGEMLRAASSYAKMGYDPALHMHQQGHRTQSLPPAPALGTRGRRFENRSLGQVPTQYINRSTGRSLTTQLPFDRPMSRTQQRPLSPASKELTMARHAAQTRSAAGSSPRHSTDAVLSAALGGDMPVQTIDRSRVPLQGIKGLVHHPVDHQLVRLPAGMMATSAPGFEGPGGASSVTNADAVAGRTPRHHQHLDHRSSTLADTYASQAATTTALAEAVREREQMPKPSEVLKRYKLFSVRTDDGATGTRNMQDLLNPTAKVLERAARPVPPGAVVAQERQKVTVSNTVVDITAPDGSRPAYTLDRGSGATSHAILQNKLGSTRMGGQPLPRGGSGLVVGNLYISHDQLVPATLVAAKWGRIAHTTYGKGSHEPCVLRCEMQPLYYESFQKDCESVLGPMGTGAGIIDNSGDVAATIGGSRVDGVKYSAGWYFKPDVEPTTFLADIGTVNAAVHGHRPSNVRAPPIGSWDATGIGRGHAATSTYDHQGRLVAATTSADGLVDGEHAENDDGGAGDGHDGGGGSSANAKARSPSGGKNAFSIADVAKSKHGGGELVEDDMRSRRKKIQDLRKKTKKKREVRVPTQDDVRRAELRIAIDLGKEKANDLLLKLAKDGNDYAMAQLLTKGYSIDYNPNPWYVQMAEKQQKAKEAARSRSFGDGDGTGDAPKSRNNAGYTTTSAGVGQSHMRNPADDTDGSLDALASKQTEVFVLPNVNATDADGNTSLMLAAACGWTDAAIVLLRHGADHKRKNNLGQTAYDLAKAESNTASVALHVSIPGAAERKRRAARLVQMLDDRTVLVCAQKGDIRRMTYLVDDCQHPVNAVNQYGMTPLHFAVIRRDLAMMEFLAVRGADIEARNNLGQSPLSLVTDAAGDALQNKMLKALSAGQRMRAQQEAAARAAAEEAAMTAARERNIVKQLKTATKGTTAAKAVHLALSGTGDHPSFGPPPGHKPDVTSDRLGYGNASGTQPLTKLVGLPGGYADGRQHPYPYQSRPVTSSDVHLQPRPLTTALKRAALAGDAGALAESWNRHVINYLALQQKQAHIRDAQRSIAEREIADAEMAERRRRTSYVRERPNSPMHAPRYVGGRPDTAASGEVQPPGTPHHVRIARTVTHVRRGSKFDAVPSHFTGGDVEDAVRAVLVDPTSVNDRGVRNEPVPAADSARFEAWAKMRFGTGGI